MVDLTTTEWLEKSRRGKRSRRRGHKFECEIAEFFRNHGYSNCVTSRAGDRSEDNRGVDLVNTGEFVVQCKRGKKYCRPIEIYNILSSNTEIPVLVTKGDHLDALAVVRLEDFGKLLDVLLSKLKDD